MKSVLKIEQDYYRDNVEIIYPCEKEGIIEWASPSICDKYSKHLKDGYYIFEYNSTDSRELFLLLIKFPFEIIENNTK